MSPRPATRQLLASLLLGLFATIAAVAADGPARRVVIVAMDGLRPDSVTEADMPNLSRMAREGTFFASHHPVYVSSTEVNGASLATGMTPARTGVTGNVEYRPEVDPARVVAMDDEWAAWRGDDVSGGKWLMAKTLPEIVRASGGRTAVAGTKGVAFLWDRLREGRTIESPTLYAGEAIPTAFRDRLLMARGPLPPAAYSTYFPNRAQDAWTTQALISTMWAGGVPTLSVVWLSEPDYAQHATGPGSRVAREALKSSDENLGRILTALDRAGVRAQTDVLVVSDHGFSTVAQPVDVISDLRAKGFNAVYSFLEAPAPGTVVMVPLGGTVAYHVVGRDEAAIDRLVRYLQTQGYTGVLFTRGGNEGTFKFSDVGLDAPAVADVVMSLRWSAETFPRREGAMPGLVLSTSYEPGQGMHGTLSRFDMRNTLIAAGPGFKKGLRSTIPSGNADVAPTVLRLLGLTPPQPMDGRVLEEALAGSSETPAHTTETITAKRTVDAKAWQQYLKISRVAGRSYYDEGNAGAPP